MSSPLVLGRLLWRPASLGFFFLVLFASFLSIIDTLSIHGVMFGTKEALWRFVILLPAAVGVALSMITVEALHTQFAWTLPRLREGIFTAKLVAMILVSALVAYNMRYNNGIAPILPPLGLGALFFALGGVAVDPLSTRLESRGVSVALLLLLLRPDLLEQVAGAQPMLLGFLGAAPALLLLRREFSADRVRQRPFVAAMPVGASTDSNTRAYWARIKRSDSLWSGSLWRGGLFDWLRACNYEVFGGTSREVVQWLVFQFALIGGFAYYFGTPAMVAYLPAISLVWIGFQLQGRFLYPVSRRARADLLFFGTLVQITAICVFAAVTLAILHLIGPRPGVDADETAAEALPMVLFVFALAPIGQWGKVGRPLMTDGFGSTRQTLIAFGMIALWMTPAIVSHQATENLALLTRVVLAALVSVVTYTVYWFALRWYHARKDLVFLPAG